MYQKDKISTASFLFVSLILTILVVGLTPINVLSYDVFGYYLYLPLKFKYNDLTIQNYQTIEHVLNTYHNSETFYQAVKWDNGNWVMRYPIGLAILYAPFYFIADIIAPLLGYEADGFSKPYQLSILYGCLLYSITGLYYLRKVLLHFFSDVVSAITLFSIGLGTNYFFHSALHGQGAMSHNILFSLYAIVIYLTIQWHQNFGAKHATLLGICIGITVLSRASEIVIILIPLLYSVSNIKSLKEKVRLLLKYKSQVIILGLIVAAFGAVQFVYWKYATGKFIVNPYGAGNPGEGFEFGSPYFLEVLFSFRKGWFVYTPLMLFAMFGIWQLYKNDIHSFVAITTYFILNLYIVSSWSCWWYGSCLGNRALIPSYAVLSIPLGFAIQKLLKSDIKFLYVLLISLFISLNLFQSWQMYKGILDSTNVSRKFYFSTFLQTSTPTQDQVDLLLMGKFNNGIEVFTHRDSIKHQRSFVLASEFEEMKHQNICDTLYKNGTRSFYLDKATCSSFSISASVEQITKKSYAWVKGSVWLFPSKQNQNVLFSIHMKHKGYIFKEKKYYLDGETLKANTWNYIEYYYLIPDDLRSKKDEVWVCVINQDADIILIDDLKLEGFEPIIDQSYF